MNRHWECLLLAIFLGMGLGGCAKEPPKEPRRVPTLLSCGPECDTLVFQANPPGLPLTPDRAQTEIFYSYRVRLVPPPGMPDWRTKSAAVLPGVQLAALQPSGAVDDQQKWQLVGKDGPVYLTMAEGRTLGFVTNRLTPGEYAFVRLIDPAQTDGQGLACLDEQGRPMSKEAVVALKPGETVYAGELEMEISLTRSSDPNVLTASFSKLSVGQGLSDAELARYRIDPAIVTRRTSALASCRTSTFADLGVQRVQCQPETRGELDKALRRKKISVSGNREFFAGFFDGMKQVLPCPN
jgi:hypothetical protein